MICLINHTEMRSKQEDRDRHAMHKPIDKAHASVTCMHGAGHTSKIFRATEVPKGKGAEESSSGCAAEEQRTRGRNTQCNCTAVMWF